jgi:hypothetical protein
MEDRVATKAGIGLRKDRTQFETGDLLFRDVNI